MTQRGHDSSSDMRPHQCSLAAGQVFTAADIEAKFMRADLNIKQKFWAPRDRLPVNGKIDAFA
jgi:hypothetical protein